GGAPPGGGVVATAPRRSGRTYETPVLAFADGPVYRIALTYGPGVDWLKNVRAAGRFELRRTGRTLTLVDPEVIEDPAAAWAPPVVRQVLRAIGARYHLRATVREQAGPR
ncbi:nitroreductase family deazaflavin-dependent oxidoreductase, partial [Nocardia farcinica]|uniref:nitroreductase family deazaflavin-dependent oxidoreductase n=1 Tax=Nocardia farcinica TaxID=37329 RepID=UPI0024582467